MKKTVLRATALLLGLLLMLNISLGTIAETDVSIVEATSAALGYIELEELRDQHTKYFETASGMRLAAIYNDPVHYLTENEQWADIDNSLTLKNQDIGVATFGVGTTSDVSYYENNENPFKVRLPQKLSSATSVQVLYQEHMLEFRMLDTVSATNAVITTNDTTAEQRDALLAAAADATEVAEAQELEQQAVTLLPNQVAGLSYPNVKENMHLSYEVNGQKLKESIILTAPTTEEEFSFALNYDGLTPVVQPYGAVYFYAEGQTDGEPVFVIQAPYMEDSAVEDTLCMDIAVSVMPTSTGCVYTITPDTAWLNDPARVYPVTIDPTIAITSTTGNIDDVGVNEYNPTTNYETVDRMYVGSNYSSGTAYESRIYIRFPRASGISTGAYIYKATMYLEHYENASWQTAENNTLDLYDVGSYNWNPATMTWNSQKSYTFTNLIATTQTDADKTTDSFDITALVQQWYNTSAGNNGVVIKPRAKDTAKTNRSCVFSSDCSATYQSRRPNITVRYFDDTPNANISDGSIYFLRNKNSNKYMDVQNAGGSGTGVIQSEYTGQSNKRWRVFHMGGGVYRFAPMHNQGLSLTVPDFNDANGTDLQVQTFAHQLTQLFYIKSIGDNAFCIQSINGTGTKAVEIESAGTVAGSVVQIWEYDGVSPQMMWYFDFDDLSGAPSYDDIETTSSAKDCFGFALQVDIDSGGDMFNFIPGQSNATSHRDETITYFNSLDHERVARIRAKDTFPTCELQPGEYRVAVRAGEYKVKDLILPIEITRYDYHYMIQLNTGEWAHKQADKASQNLGYVNPSDDAVWNGYQGETLYFVVTAP